MAKTVYLRPTGAADRSTWRRRANAVIQQVFNEHPELVADATKHKELKKLVSAAYPFGERRHWPYKAWGSAVRDAFYRLSQNTKSELGPIHRKCRACGAKAGLRCRGIGPGDPVFEHELVIQDAEMDGKPPEIIQQLRDQIVLHESRNPPPPTLPLFEGIGG